MVFDNSEDLRNKFKGIDERGTHEVFNLLLGDMTLSGEQLVAVQECCTAPNSKGILSAEMGMGKSYITVPLLQVARCLNSGKKAILTVPKNKVKEFEELITSTLKCRVMTVTGQKPDIERLERNFDNVDVVLAQISFWTHSVNSLIFIYNHVDEFVFSLFDEAAGKEAAGFLAFLEFSRKVPMSYLANGTPIAKDTTLTRHLLYAIKATDQTDNQFKNKYTTKTTAGKVKKVDAMAIKRDFSEYFINMNRKDIGLETKTAVTFHRLSPTTEQQEWIGKGLRTNIALYNPEVTKLDEGIEFRVKPQLSPAYVPALKQLQSIIIGSEKKSIIFAKNTDTIVQLNILLKSLGKNPYIIDGKHTRTSEEQLQSALDYNDDPNGIMITNIIQGTNLGTANHIIIYDTPPDVQQLIFRAIRGMKSKSITIDWIYYPMVEQHVIADAVHHVSNVSTLLEREIDILPQLNNELNFIRSNYRL